MTQDALLTNSSSLLKKIVVVGGGTGTFVVISGLKQYPVDLNAVVSVADSGGSTGRLRDEFGFLPVGDLRQALAALAHDHDQNWIQALLLYRFSKGSGLEGHNLGNLILTALQDMTGSTAKAVELASQIFRLQGHIFPITTQKVDLVVEYMDGSFVIGEDNLNSPHTLPNSKLKKSRIKHIHLSPKARIYPKAQRALNQANLIVLGPGDLYASIMPNLVVTGLKSTFRQTQARLVYIVNLMTSYSQTTGLSASQHIKIIEKQIGRQLDYLIINSEPIPKNLLEPYSIAEEYPVVDDLPQSPHVIRMPLLKKATYTPQKGDQLARSFLRQDSIKLGRILYQLL
jgi:uncharacterized cofD-like protein